MLLTSQANSIPRRATSNSGGGTTGNAAAGKAVFTSAGCAGCHTLAAAGANGQVGPNLDQLKPNAALVRKTIKEGPSVMPANLLTGATADAVSKYVADNAGR